MKALLNFLLTASVFGQIPVPGYNAGSGGGSGSVGPAAAPDCAIFSAATAVGGSVDCQVNRVAFAQPPAPVLGGAGAIGGMTTYGYTFVMRSIYGGSVPSTETKTTTGQAMLSMAVPITMTVPACTAPETFVDVYRTTGPGDTGLISPYPSGVSCGGSFSDTGQAITDPLSANDSYPGGMDNSLYFGSDIPMVNISSNNRFGSLAYLNNDVNTYYFGSVPAFGIFEQSSAMTAANVNYVLGAIQVVDSASPISGASLEAHVVNANATGGAVLNIEDSSTGFTSTGRIYGIYQSMSEGNLNMSGNHIIGHLLKMQGTYTNATDVAAWRALFYNPVSTATQDLSAYEVSGGASGASPGVGNFWAYRVGAKNDGLNYSGPLAIRNLSHFYGFGCSDWEAGETNTSTVDTIYCLYSKPPANHGGGSLVTNYIAEFNEDIGGVSGFILNGYYAWDNPAGVYRRKQDCAFNSVCQSVSALYNPQFATKYTPGNPLYERLIMGRWNGNVSEIGTEAGGTGTVRDLRLLGPTIHLGTAANIGATTFTGAGLNDGVFNGTYTGATLTYCAIIDGTGTPDTFKWGTNGTCDNGAMTVAITGANQGLSNGAVIKFGATTGHTLTDKWSATATAAADYGTASATQLNFAALKTTGAATGKTVVCVDTTTGILYASTSGTQCLN